VSLGKDFQGKISDFSVARNHFLSKYEWVLFIDDDEEASGMLLRYLEKLEPVFPYYWIRRVNLNRGRYKASWNPELVARFVSNKVRYAGRVHETVVPRKPHGVIDFPIIHNHLGLSYYKNHWYQDHPLYRVLLGAKKVAEVVRDR
jgi:hypothetical protein